ncbi:MAG: hypothetical protein DMD98_04870 [Candidatus Rokuibacteriota bacterium]|nr:MAG: hypothetical protein AUH14_09525 [Candidatus Rokubacteria bacterium 13_2_20CM_69_15_1]OLB53904.1 MAG: hypothetical protein AUH99_00925 [Candidatus Rokubacteria bacterium 13_2_20CM_2_70_11]PYN37814.1 MAG: hypothetical protein DMD98_04870 [Candidatus Rokubacteria bacterium]
MRGIPARVTLVVAERYLTPQRAWLDGLAIIVPAATATRWLLVADLACLIAVGLGMRPRLLGVLLALGGGFFVLNGLGMVLTDFYLALALFHLGVGVTAVLCGRLARWLGAAALGLALLLGALT